MMSEQLESPAQETASFPAGVIESIDFGRGAVSGWIEVRDGQIPHLQIREGNILRSSSFMLGHVRHDVSAAKGIEAVTFKISAGQALSPNDVQKGTAAVHALWGFEDRPLPLVGKLQKSLGDLVDSMPADLKQRRGSFAHVAAPFGTHPTSSEAQMSSFEIAVGTTSGDGVIMAGDSGHLFLRGGGNSLEFQYAWGTPAGPPGSTRLIEERAEGWANIFSQRARSLEALGVPFRQVIFPEKNSVFPELLPLDVETPTPLCRRLLREVSQEAWFIDSFAMFNEWDESVAPSWMKVDSHFSSQAALAVTKSILTDLGLCDDSLFDGIRIGPDFEYLRGEMGWRLVGFDMYDRLDLPAESTLEKFGPLIDPVSSKEPAGGGHIGASVEWHNELAPIDAHVLVFGNSFFGRGHKPNQVSWWFSRLVKRFTMVWDPDLDIQMVERLGPDAVVCQTVERFLMKVPRA
jgi:hypothetical protein